MEISNLKNLCVSNLILIILNNKNNDELRKYAEIELRKRIKDVGVFYDDLLHFDDKAIKIRGLDIDNYLLSPYVNMQQLMEIYFKYLINSEYHDELLFSEKHLCNFISFGTPFFRKIVSKEIKNIDKRLNNIYNAYQTDLLLEVREKLLERLDYEENYFDKLKKDSNIFQRLEISLGSNEALAHLEKYGTCHEFLYNYSDEELYKILSSKNGKKKINLLLFLNDTIFDEDIVQNYCGQRFIKKDSNKLNLQKSRLYYQAKNSFEVNYYSPLIQDSLKKVKKIS